MGKKKKIVPKSPSVQEFIASSSSGGNASSKQERPNPLLNPLILETLFKVCSKSKEDLSSYRRVCKVWHDVSLGVWRETMELQVYPTAVYAGYPYPNYWLRSREYPPGSYLTMGNLLKLIDESKAKQSLFKFDSYPFRNVSVFSNNVADDGLLDQKFWDICGPFIHKLRLYTNHGLRMSELETMLVKKMPNLKALMFEIHGYYFHSESIEEVNSPSPVEEHLNLKAINMGSGTIGVLNSWLGFFRQYPYLESFSLSFEGRFEFEKYEKLEKLLGAALQIRLGNKEKLCIKHLKIWDCRYRHSNVSEWEFQNSILDLFQKLDFPLETLELDLECDCREEFIEPMIRFHASTLKTLKLFRGQSEKVFANFPFGIMLESLTRLELCGHITSNLSFLRFTPNLKYLSIDPDTESDTLPCCNGKVVEVLGVKHNFVWETKEYCDMSNVKLVALTNLHTGFLLMDKQSMKLLATWMPNVEIYSGELKADAFRGLCNQWQTTLQELSLKIWSDINDEVITGLSPVTRPGSIGSLEARNPLNITCLKKLKKVKLKRPDRWYVDDLCKHRPPKLTEHTVREGFMPLPVLREMDIFMTEEMGLDIRMDLVERGIQVNLCIEPRCDCFFEATAIKNRKVSKRLYRRSLLP